MYDTGNSYHRIDFEEAHRPMDIYNINQKLVNHFDKLKNFGKLTIRQSKMLDELAFDLVGQFTPVDLSDDEDLDGDISNFNEEGIINVLNQVWLNPKYDSLIIETIQKTDSWDSGNWNQVYPFLYDEINKEGKV